MARKRSVSGSFGCAMRRETNGAVHLLGRTAPLHTHMRILYAPPCLMLCGPNLSGLIGHIITSDRYRISFLCLWLHRVLVRAVL